MTKDDELKRKLEKLRRNIDEIDKEIINLLQRRFNLALEIGKIKKQTDQEILDLSREREILARILKENEKRKNGKIFPSESLKTIYSEIIATCRSAQKPLKIAYLGPEATFSHIAALKFFGHAQNFSTQQSILDVFEEVDSGRADYGVVPVENSIEGTVATTLDAFLEFKLKIWGEIYVPITHALINQTGRKEDIRKIISHPHALAQCRKWLRKNFPSVPLEEAFSTGYAAKWAAVDASIAAIASPLAARTYHLQIVATHIEDYRGNSTRFLIIGKESPAPTSKDKTSLIIGLKDYPGALYQVLKPFAEKKINMTKIESRPVKGEAWRYLFFIDIEGHWDDPQVREGIEEMKDLCYYLKWLGSYPIGAPSNNDLF